MELVVMATDVDGVYLDRGTPTQRRLGQVTPQDLAAITPTRALYSAIVRATTPAVAVDVTPRPT